MAERRSLPGPRLAWVIVAALLGCLNPRPEDDPSNASPTPNEVGSGTGGGGTETPIVDTEGGGEGQGSGNVGAGGSGAGQPPSSLPPDAGVEPVPDAGSLRDTAPDAATAGGGAEQ